MSGDMVKDEMEAKRAKRIVFSFQFSAADRGLPTEN
jgi:hypothetical protein